MTPERLLSLLNPRDGRVRLDGRSEESSMSPSIGGVCRDYFDGVLEIVLSPGSRPEPLPTFVYAGAPREAVRVTGTLGRDFLGRPSMAVDARFFVLNDRAEVLMTLADPPDSRRLLSSLSPGTSGADDAFLGSCRLILDSTRPYALGDNADTLSPGGPVPATTGLYLTTELRLSELDAMLCDFLALGPQMVLTVGGPVHLAAGQARICLATNDPSLDPALRRPLATLALPHLPGLALDVHYQLVTVPGSARHVAIREQLMTAITHESLTVPLRIAFEPNSLSESLTVESFNQQSSLSLDTLKGLLPGNLAGAIPPRIPVLSDLKLTRLAVTMASAPLALQEIGVRVELAPADGWSIVPARPDLLVFRGLALDISALRDPDQWEIQLNVTGTLSLAGGTLDVGVDVSAATLCCILREHDTISLERLFTELAFDGGNLPSHQGASVDHLEIWSALDGSMYTVDIGTVLNWPILPPDKLIIERLRFGLEYADDAGPAITLGGALTIAGIHLELLGRSSPEGGWLFEGSTGRDQKLEIGRLIDEGVKLFDPKAALPPALTTFSLENLGVSYNTRSGDFTFRATGTIPLGDGAPTLLVTVTIGTTHGKAVFGGTIIVGGAQFRLAISSENQNKELAATWVYEDGAAPLALEGVTDDLPALSALGDLPIPQRASLVLSLSEGNTRLSLDCTYANAFKAAFLFAQTSGATHPTSLVALGVAVPPLSTESLGPLGPALRPHNIRLSNLVVVAANADAPDTLTLPLDGAVPIGKGLLLQGAVEFQGTSFSYPFECRLGGEQSEEPSEDGLVERPKEIPARGATSNPPVQRSAPDEGKNNVRVGRTIGPVTFRKARLESRDQRVYVVLDASLGAGGFELALDGFNINFPLTLLVDAGRISEIGVGLDGLSIAYSKPPLAISGGFARRAAVAPYVDHLYEGHLLIKAQTFQVAVLGSYGTILVNQEKQPSLFIYGAYDGVVGGPPAFFVTGLALGGGYNSRLALPPVEQVADFPLIQAVTAPTKFKIDALRQAVLPSSGDYWLALGVRFTSFKMADSFALLSVAFGHRLQFALLGLTTLTVPPGAGEDTSAVYAELAIRAVVDPDAGVFSIEGRLTDRSHIFAKEIHLTGGFAFFVWFGKAKEAGDFVISLGGYHPEFVSPPHYPVVPRIGIRAQLSEAVTIAGEAYLAITPSCLMAGLKLGAVFSSGNLTAAFVAYADFLVAWAPFHYDATVGMAIAITVQLPRPFKLEVSASLHVWGPPFAGTARVSLPIVSFAVDFGDHSGTARGKLEWDEFQQAFLPPPAHPGGTLARLSTIRITEGLLREVRKEAVTYRVVNPHELTIETDSAVPCSAVTVGAATRTGTRKIGIRPMAAETLTSVHAVSFIRRGEAAAQTPVEEHFRVVQWSRRNFPDALWSAAPLSGPPAPGMVEDVPSGVVLRVQPTVPPHRLGPFPIDEFKHQPVPKRIAWAAAQPVPGARGEPFSGVSAGNALRVQIRDCLAKRAAKPGSARWNDIAMGNTQARPLELFQAPPTGAALGQRL